MLRKVVVGSGLLGFIPSVEAATPVESKQTPIKPPPMRPSDLPIYEAPHADYADYVQAKENESKMGYVRSVIIQPIRTVREQAQTALAHTDSFTTGITDQIHEVQDRTAWIVKYLREEENKEVRYGAVAMGGLTGFIFGLRGGFFRRIIYAGLGTSAMGAVCFPEETSEVMKNNGVFVRQYINIAYNFLYGVKPGDPQLEVKFPELSFPKNMSEFVDVTVSLASTVKQAVMPPPTKDNVTKETNKPADEKTDKTA